MTLTEMKARAYDLIARKKRVQRQFDQVNARISELFQQQQAEQEIDASIAQLVETDTEGMVT